MTPLQIVCSLLEAVYSHASVQIEPPAELCDIILEWGRLNIPDKVLHTGEDGGTGRERECHVTVKYGMLAGAVPEKLREIAKATPPFPVVLGKVSLFTTSPDYDVVKLDVESPRLMELNRQVSAAIPNEDKFPDYRPHLTLAYVQKGTCDRLVGEDPFRAEGVARQFLAAGMTFCGAGDDQDPARVKEVLLFSRVRKKVAEAVITVSDEQMEDIVSTIQAAVDNSNGDVSTFLELANGPLSAHHVQFARHEAHAHGPAAVATPDGVYLAVPTASQIRMPGFAKHMGMVLHHELVHDKQMGRSASPHEMYSKAMAWVVPGGQLDQDRYLQQKQEVMAWAASLVNSWRRQGLTQAQMMQRLRAGEWGFGAKYWQGRKKFPATFNRFVKQAAEYVAQMGESAGAEGPDPFAACTFPTGPDRVRQFFLSNGRRRAVRPIL